MATNPPHSRQFPTLAELREKHGDAARYDVTPEQIDAAIDASVNPSGPNPAQPYQVGTRLSRGFVGEENQAQWQQQQGEMVLEVKLDPKQTNQGGFDNVSFGENEHGQLTLYVTDNKAWNSGRPVYSVSALEQNYQQNLEALRERMDAMSKDPSLPADQRELAGLAVELIDAGRVQPRVSNAGAVTNTPASGVANPAIEFQDTHGEIRAAAQQNPVVVERIVDREGASAEASQPVFDASAEASGGPASQAGPSSGSMVTPVFDASTEASGGPASQAGPSPSTAATPVFDQAAPSTTGPTSQPGASPSASPTSGPGGGTSSGPSGPLGPQAGGTSSGGGLGPGPRPG